MKLRLSCWAEALRSKFVERGVYVIVTCLHDEPGMKPTILGQTEVIMSTTHPDWTKTFVIDYEFGEEQNLILTLYNGGNNTPISSTLFEIGQVLGNGGTLGKELKDGNGMVIIRVDECNSFGQVQVQIRGLNLKNLDGIGFGMNKSDPFFEVQRHRVATNSNSPTWDAVYRSITIDNDLNPIFPEFFIDLDELTGSNDLGEKFRIVVYDYDSRGSKEIGSCLLTMNDLIDNVNETALCRDTTKIDTSKALPLTVGQSQDVTGKIIVAKATLIGVPVVPLTTNETSTGMTEATSLASQLTIEEKAPLNTDNKDAEVDLSDAILVVVNCTSYAPSMRLLPMAIHDNNRRCITLMITI